MEFLFRFSGNSVPPLFRQSLLLLSLCCWDGCVTLHFYGVIGGIAISALVIVAVASVVAIVSITSIIAILSVFSIRTVLAISAVTVLAVLTVFSVTVVVAVLLDVVVRNGKFRKRK